MYFGLVTTDINRNCVRNYTKFTFDVYCENFEKIFTYSIIDSACQFVGLRLIVIQKVAEIKPYKL